ncbi:MAG: hypothetical protein ACM336_16760 [Acidobacteriota bacterium]|nr:hypothetical protein [Bryobacteraceae bacterium]
MRLAVAAALAALTLCAAGTLDVFDLHWSVPDAADWKIDREDSVPVLRLLKAREPLPGPRRPIQFAVAETPAYRRLTIEADAMPLGEGLMVVFAYRDAAHFNYAHLATNTGVQFPVHNGIMHVYGGERVRISPESGPPAFTASGRWHHVKLEHDAATGAVSVTVDGRANPALSAVDRSLGAGKIGLGSFDETGAFKNVKIGVEGSGS